MSSTCKFCETQQTIVDKQTIADEEVANGKITEGKYLAICDTIKKLYQNLLERCECNKQVELHLEDDEILVEEVAINGNNTIELRGLEGMNFRNKYMHRNVLVGAEMVDGKRLVFGNEYTDDGSPEKHIYYDSSDNLFKQERDWVETNI